MTISSNVRKAGPFQGNDVTTVFPFDFKIFSAADVRVVLTMPSGLELLLIRDSDYQVQVNEDQGAFPGGSILYPLAGAALGTGWRLTVVGDIEALQPADITNQGGFYPQVVEDMADRLTILIQQAEEELGRALRFPVSDSATTLDLPPTLARANRVLGFDSLGNLQAVQVVSGAQVAVTSASLVVAAAGQTDVELSFGFTPGVNALLVFKNGLKQVAGEDYLELAEDAIRFLAPLAEGDEIESVCSSLTDANLDQISALAAAAAVSQAAAADSAAFAQSQAERAEAAADTSDALVLRSDLQDPSDPTKGAALVAFGSDNVSNALLSRVVQVATIADLRNIEPAFDGQQCELRGHTVAGIGGGIFYADYSSSEPDDNGVTVVTVGGRRWLRRLDGFVMPEFFGAVGDGLADDTIPIVSAINGFSHIKASTGKVYRTTQTITVDKGSLIVDFQKSTIRLDDPSGTLSHMKIGAGTTQRTSVRIWNITFSRTQAATSGYAIDSDFFGVSDISGCRIFGDNKIHGGIRVYRGIMVNVFENYIQNCINHGIYLQGTGGGNDRTVDVCIRENRVDGCVNALNTYDFVEGVFCRDNIFYNQTGSSVSCNASSDANGLVSFKFQNNDFDSAGGSGLFMQNIGSVQVTGNWFSNNQSGTATAMQVGSNCTGLVITGNLMFGKAGVPNVKLDGRQIVFTGNQIAAGSDGVYLSSTCENVTISGNSFNYLGGVGVNAYAAPVEYSVTGNTFKGVTTPVGVGGSKYVVDTNLGYSTAQVTYNPPSISAGSVTTTDVTVNGARTGDIVDVSFSQHFNNPQVSIYGVVSANDTVQVVLRNGTGAAVDLPSGTLKVSVKKLNS